MSEHSLRSHMPGRMIPVGSQVVLRVAKPTLASASSGPIDLDETHRAIRKPGSVGMVRECPARVDGPYLIEFTNGDLVAATSSELSLRREEVDSELAAQSHDLRPYIIYRCQVGSKAYGLAHDASDDDIRGIFLPPARLHWSLYTLPEQIESIVDGHDEVYWELEKFLRLALKANPNVLETLWTPMVHEADDTAQQLRAIRDRFLSKHLYKTYSGYVLSQFRRMQRSQERTGSFKRKHAMHLIRLLLSGLHALREGDILVDVGGHREELLNIRNGEVSLVEIQRRALEIDQAFQREFERTRLPDQPDFETIDRFLIEARRRAVDGWEPD
ncbi:MAG: nucleotidyltransferase domain-containing protein [Planctomycetales bacterium]|nr:nucleotidyltransferase domain-containing protein [Planctomycetales bacterium]